MAMLITHRAIAQMVKKAIFAIMSTIVMASGNFIMENRGYPVKEHEQTSSVIYDAYQIYIFQTLKKLSSYFVIFTVCLQYKNANYL